MHQCHLVATYRKIDDTKILCVLKYWEITILRKLETMSGVEMSAYGRQMNYPMER